MRTVIRYHVLAFLCAAWFLLLGTPQVAQAQDTPAGTYRDSCRNIYPIDGGGLFAECRTMRGTWTRTQLDAMWCVSEVRNYDGALDCAMSGDAPLPRGSYRRSCVQLRVNEGELSALCRTETGEWRATNIKPSECLNTIKNTYGRLACDMGDQLAPPGSYRNSCYGIRMRGGTLSAVCQTRSRIWQPTKLNDVARCDGGDVWNDDGMLRCNKW